MKNKCKLGLVISLVFIAITIEYCMFSGMNTQERNIITSSFLDIPKETGIFILPIVLGFLITTIVIFVYIKNSK